MQQSRTAASCRCLSRGLARSLDAVGDRWSLLIVRELLRCPMRYGELGASLGGIATNLLAGRLRSMESSGVIERRLGETSGVVYALTPWGSQLREAVELGIEVSDLVMTLRIDQDGPHVTLQPDRRPGTILTAEPEVVLGLAAGVISIDEALSGASVHGDRRVLTTVLPGAQA